MWDSIKIKIQCALGHNKKLAEISRRSSSRAGRFRNVFATVLSTKSSAVVPAHVATREVVYDFARVASKTSLYHQVQMSPNHCEKSQSAIMPHSTDVRQLCDKNPTYSVNPVTCPEDDNTQSIIYLDKIDGSDFSDDNPRDMVTIVNENCDQGRKLVNTGIQCDVPSQVLEMPESKEPRRFESRVDTSGGSNASQSIVSSSKSSQKSDLSGENGKFTIEHLTHIRASSSAFRLVDKSRTFNSTIIHHRPTIDHNVRMSVKRSPRLLSDVHTSSSHLHPPTHSRYDDHSGLKLPHDNRPVNSEHHHSGITATNANDESKTNITTIKTDDITVKLDETIRHFQPPELESSDHGLYIESDTHYKCPQSIKKYTHCSSVTVQLKNLATKREWRSNSTKPRSPHLDHETIHHRVYAHRKSMTSGRNMDRSDEFHAESIFHTIWKHKNCPLADAFQSYPCFQDNLRLPSCYIRLCYGMHCTCNTQSLLGSISGVDMEVMINELERISLDKMHQLKARNHSYQKLMDALTERATGVHGCKLSRKFMSLLRDYRALYKIVSNISVELAQVENCTKTCHLKERSGQGSMFAYGKDNEKKRRFLHSKYDETKDILVLLRMRQKRMRSMLSLIKLSSSILFDSLIIEFNNDMNSSEKIQMDILDMQEMLKLRTMQVRVASSLSR